jgi:soluble lytic murein transglycosylase-like protein
MAAAERRAGSVVIGAATRVATPRRADMVSYATSRGRAFAHVAAIVAAVILALAVRGVHAGAQVEERLAPSVVTVMSRAISDQPAPANYAAKPELRAWLDQMSQRLAPRIADSRTREDFLATVHYEATRAGLDPQLVLGVIQYESAFRKYAISVAGARGFMQVMPFWSNLIGSSQHNLFHLRTNLRYGCVILRHYLDIESGDLYRALGRYNGSLGQPDYPNAVMAAWNRNWTYTPPSAGTKLGAVVVVPTVAR